MTAFSSLSFTRAAPPIWARGKSGGISFTLAQFAIPAVDAVIEISIDETSWTQQGQYLLIGLEVDLVFTGGLFRVVDVLDGRISATHVAYDQNSPLATLIPVGSKVAIAGRPDQTALASQYSDLAEAAKIAAEAAAVAGAISADAAAAAVAQVTADAAAADAAKLAAVAAKEAAETAQAAADTAKADALAAKDAAELAETNAADSALSASGSVDSISGSVAQAETARNASEGFKDVAEAAKLAAQTASATATEKAAEAVEANDLATAKASIAVTKAAEAAASAANSLTNSNDALAAKEAAETAKTAAEGYAVSAQGSASTASVKAGEAAVSASVAASLEAGRRYMGMVAGASVAGISAPVRGDTYLVNVSGGGFTYLDLITRNTAGGWDVLPVDVWMGIRSSDFAAREPRKAIISDGTSSAGYAGSPASLDFGTDDITFGMWCRLPDYTPATQVTLAVKNDSAGSPGVAFSIQASTGKMIAYLSDGSAIAPFVSSEAITTNNGDWVFLAYVLDKSSTFQPYLNEAPLGSPVDISSVAAHTLTSTAPLRLLSNSDGTVNYPAAFGETFIASGALTAAQIAQIHSRGTAVGMGLTMLGHWVPGGRGPFLQDVSGNSAHFGFGSTGITFSHPEPYVADSRPVDGLRSSGAAGAKTSVDISNQPIGTGDFAVWQELKFPTDTATASTKNLWVITSNTSETHVANALLLGYFTGAGLFLRFYGATTADNIELTSLDLLTRFQTLASNGVPCWIGVARKDGVMSIYTKIGGDPVLNITNLFTEDPDGSAPAWSDSIDGTSLLPGYRNTSYSSNLDLLHQRLFNYAPASTDEAAQMAAGVLPASIAKGWSNVFSTDFSTDVGWNFSNGAASVAGGVLDYDGSLDVTCSLTPDWYSVGDQIRLTFDASDAGRVFQFNASGNQTWTQYSYAANFNTVAGENEYVLTITAAGYLDFGFRFFASSGAWSMDNLRIDRLGCTIDADFRDGGGFQAKNLRAENGSGHFELSTTGIEWLEKAPIGKRVARVKTFSHSEISTTGLATAWGTLPLGWRVVEHRWNVTAAFDAGTTIGIGKVGNWSYWLLLAALDVTGEQVQVSQSLIPESAATSQYIYKNQATTVGAVEITQFIERIF